MSSETAVRRVLEIAASNVVVRDVVLFGEGWDNRLYLVNEDLIVRVAKREQDQTRLLTEARLLEAIGPRLPIQVPIPEFVHEPDPECPIAAFGYRMIRGERLSQMLEGEHIAMLAGGLCTFLNRLHGTPEAIYGPLELPHFSPGAWLGRQSDLVDATDPALRADLDPATYRRFRAWWDDYRLDEAAVDFDPCLIHGDLAAEHVLVTKVLWRVAGVIDFGDAMIADPALDLAGLPDRLAYEIVQSLDAIGDPKAAWRRRDSYRRIVPLHAFWAGLQRDDSRLLDEGIRGIEARFNS